MPTFKDLNGKEWTVALDAPKILRVRKELDVDPVSSEGYETLYDDDVTLACVLAIVCADQLKTAGVSTDQFCEAVIGDATDRARKAFNDAVLDFSPSRKREVMRAVAAKVEKARDVAMNEAMSQINSPEFEERLMAATKARAGNAIEEALTLLASATTSPAQSASTPKVEPGKN